MPDFISDGVRLHFELAGPASGTPIVLVHGFASDYDLNWRGSGWEATLAGAGRMVIGLDCRGHGHSDKPHEPAAYARRKMAADIIRLLDHLSIPIADYLGYSMGARLGLHLALEHGGRIARAALAAIDRRDVLAHVSAIADRLRGDVSVDDPVAISFHQFASARPINDLEALAACALGLDRPLEDAALAGIRVPVLIVSGDHDDLAPDAAGLAAAIPDARYVELAGRNHMNLLPARQFKAAVLEFLAI